MKTKKEGVVVIYDEKNEVIGIIIRDENTGKKIILKCEEMDIDEIRQLIAKDETTKDNKIRKIQRESDETVGR